mgnify:CR=1 FL=1
MTTLWLQYPALSWLEAIPLGNGGYGCMDFGGLSKDVIMTILEHEYEITSKRIK